MSLGSRIRAARVRAGLTLRELSAQVPVTHGAIAHYEADRDVPGSAVLIALAEALGVDMAYLFRPNEVHFGAPRWRKRPSLSQRNQAFVLAQAQDAIERYLETETLLGAEARPDLGRDLPAITSLDSVEAAADELRSQWRLGAEPIGDLTALLEDHGIRVVYVDGADAAFDAVTVLANDEVPVIALNAAFPGDRVRLSLAHELAHLVMDVRDEVDVEKAAHRFGAAFLYPASSARRDIGHERSDLDTFELHLLKHRWGVSMQCVVVRARELDIISEAATARLQRHFRSAGWAVTEPGDAYPRERSVRLERLVMKALAEGIISRPKASELLGVSFEEFGSQVARAHGAGLVAACD